MNTESDKQKKIRAEKTARELERLYPDAKCSLEYGNDPWKLLIMSRLSAQCTDARVNIVSKPLFEAFPNAESMANAKLCEIEKIIYPCGLYCTKAKSLKEMSAVITERFGGIVPDTFDELISLPGVGSKIANLMLGDVFGKGGIVADTHCIRISNRLGLCTTKAQSGVERTLGALVPKDEQSDFCHRLVLFGRDVCTARSPKCEGCVLNDKGLCKRVL